MSAHGAEILTPEACRFIADLDARFGARRHELLARRAERQREIDAGRLPIFSPRPRRSAAATGRCRAPADLLDRRTEITGPVDRKMAINA